MRTAKSVFSSNVRDDFHKVCLLSRPLYFAAHHSSIRRLAVHQVTSPPSCSTQTLPGLSELHCNGNRYISKRVTGWRSKWKRFSTCCSFLHCIPNSSGIHVQVRRLRRSSRKIPLIVDVVKGFHLPSNVLRHVVPWHHQQRGLICTGMPLFVSCFDSRPKAEYHRFASPFIGTPCACVAVSGTFRGHRRLTKEANGLRCKHLFLLTGSSTLCRGGKSFV